MRSPSSATRRSPVDVRTTTTPRSLQGSPRPPPSRRRWRSWWTGRSAASRIAGRPPLAAFAAELRACVDGRDVRLPLNRAVTGAPVDRPGVALHDEASREPGTRQFGPRPPSPPATEPAPARRRRPVIALGLVALIVALAGMRWVRHDRGRPTANGRAAGPVARPSPTLPVVPQAGGGRRTAPGGRRERRRVWGAAGVGRAGAGRSVSSDGGAAAVVPARPGGRHPAVRRLELRRRRDPCALPSDRRERSGTSTPSPCGSATAATPTGRSAVCHATVGPEWCGPGVGVTP